MTIETELEVYDDWQYGQDADHAECPAVKFRSKDLKIGQKVKVIIVQDEQLNT